MLIHEGRNLNKIFVSVKNPIGNILSRLSDQIALHITLLKTYILGHSISRRVCYNWRRRKI